MTDALCALPVGSSEAGPRPLTNREVRTDTSCQTNYPGPRYGCEANLRLAIQAAGVALWSWNVDDDTLTMDEEGYRLWGVPLKDSVTFVELSAHIHPADRDQVGAAFSATRAISGPYEIDFRILIDDKIHWVSARGQGSDVGMVGRMMFGIFSMSPGANRPKKATSFSPAR